ncbi:MAG: LPS assembly protein LptD [Pseudomonadota bacterium]
MRHLFAIIVVAFWPLIVAAQTPASLVADSIDVDPSGRVTARGNVVIQFEGTRLTANSVTYDQTGDALTFGGPITVTQPSGDVFTASNATLDRTLRNGVLASARLVLDRQLQLAASRITREGGRYTTLDRVVASSCEVCFDRPVPLWDIRADRVIHDTEERQLYFEGARLRFVGVPVLYVPRLRLPDPTLKRASGFLIPDPQRSSELGTGITLPYFFAIGDHADLRLTPYIATETRTLELRFRQETRGGRIDLEGAASDDDLDGGRGYLFADARFDLPRGFVADAQVELVSDPGYLFIYDYAERDRLENRLAFRRVREKDLFRASVTEFRTLRESEIPIRDTLTDRYLEVSYIREVEQRPFGGKTRLRFDSATLNRPSSDNVDGRDVSRIGAGIDWTRTDVFGPGIVVQSELALRVDTFNIGQDSNFSNTVTRVLPRSAVELRWPHMRTASDGTVDVVEPIIRFDISNQSNDDVPAEDSRIVEFDEANLFSFTRYPGLDASENGLRLSAGLSWRRSLPTGWQIDATFGRVSRLDGSLGYSAGSGLEGDQSQWLASARLAFENEMWLTTRSLFDDAIDFTLSETRIDWQRETWRFGSGYLFAQPEPAEGRTDELSELSFDGRVLFADNWTASSNVRYDFRAGRAARAGLGLGYANECLRLDLSVSRRFASSTSVTPITDFGFRVSLLGVGNQTRGQVARSGCS